MSGALNGYGIYRQVNVETASQGKLIVMLFNGAIQRAEEAKREIQRGHLDGVHNNLVRAQEIIAELRSALNMSTGEIAHNLDRVYEYFQHLLITANIRKDTTPIDDCIEMMSAMRDTWRELFDRLLREETPAVPETNPHGASLINVHG